MHHSFDNDDFALDGGSTKHIVRPIRVCLECPEMSFVLEIDRSVIKHIQQKISVPISRSRIRLIA
jgi:hypothetical protein